jgi:hypothetical protein
MFIGVDYYNSGGNGNGGVVLFPLSPYPSPSPSSLSLSLSISKFPIPISLPLQFPFPHPYPFLKDFLEREKEREREIGNGIWRGIEKRIGRWIEIGRGNERHQSYFAPSQSSGGYEGLICHSANQKKGLLSQPCEP